MSWPRVRDKSFWRANYSRIPGLFPPSWRESNQQTYFLFWKTNERLINDVCISRDPKLEYE